MILTNFDMTSRTEPKYAIITFVFYKLLTILGLLHNGNNLFHGNVIFNLLFPRTWRIISLHKCSVQLPSYHAPFFDVISQYTWISVIPFVIPFVIPSTIVNEGIFFLNVEHVGGCNITMWFKMSVNATVFRLFLLLVN